MDVNLRTLETVLNGPTLAGLAASLLLLWATAWASLAQAPRAVRGSRSRNRALTAAASLPLGVAWWAASVCGLATVLGGSVTQLPVSWIVLSLPGAAIVAVGLLMPALGGHRSMSALAVVGASAASLILPWTWMRMQSLTLSPGLAAAVLLTAVAAHAALVAPLAIAQVRGRRLPPSGRLAFAFAHAAAAVAGIVVLATAVPASTAWGLPRTELLLVLLASLLVATCARAATLENRLLRKHRRLSERLREAQAARTERPLRDPLTGLPNRLGIESQLRTASLHAEKRGRRVALLFIGLDGFKNVNDSYGHALGDTVLCEIARRLSNEARELESPHVLSRLLARVGGDEFALMIEGQFDRPALAGIAQRLLAQINRPVTCEQREVALSASMGLACFPDDGGAVKLMSHADSAMQAAKAAGGSTYNFFEAHMHDDAHERMELLRDLRQAVEANQLELFYQPKIDARSGQVTAAEALLRWHHPKRGIVNPSVFIPVAERYGLIGALGNWVIEDACRQAGVWRERGLKMRVAINLSVFQMRQDDLVERLRAALARHKVQPSRLTCEITESVAMEDTQVTQRTFERLGKAGIHLSIDDFGTGYSSLSYLRQLPASELKIDRSFVMDLEASADARAIVDAVLKLAHAIGLKVVAEGVETERQRDILLEMGCDEFQGFLFARPMSARALLMWAVDDRPARHAFRDSLFADTAAPVPTELRASLFEDTELGERIAIK